MKARRHFARQPPPAGLFRRPFALQPDFARVAEIDAFAVCASAPGDSCDFVFRFFAPRQGIPEDPATGTVHCTLVPYWAARLGKRELTARQLPARGSEFACALRGGRVAIAGRTVEYLRGEIMVDAGKGGGRD